VQTRECQERGDIGENVKQTKDIADDDEFDVIRDKGTKDLIESRAGHEALES